MKNLLTAAKEILHLHMCEQEGLNSGQPTPIMWLNAVDDLSDAIAEAEKEQPEVYNSPIIDEIMSQITPEEEEKVRKEMVEQLNTASAEEYYKEYFCMSKFYPTNTTINTSVLRFAEAYASLKLKAQEGQKPSDEEIKEWVKKKHTYLPHVINDLSYLRELIIDAIIAMRDGKIPAKK